LVADGHGGGAEFSPAPVSLSTQVPIPNPFCDHSFLVKKANPIFFCFFIFVNLRDGEKNPKKQIPKKKR
jgi:hypothetical protein